MNSRIISFVCLCMMVFPSLLQAQAFRDLRWEEDPIYYSDVDALPGKYIPLSEDGSSYMGLGGDVRVRFEFWDDMRFQSDFDDDFFLFRTRLHADAHLGETVRVFMEGKSALITDRDLPGKVRPIDEDTLALQQAFVDLSLTPFEQADLVLRAGRQELSFGKQRLISPDPWSNTRKTFDGLRATVAGADWTVDAFSLAAVEVRMREFNETYSDDAFHGVYASIDPSSWNGELDLYWLLRNRDVAYEDAAVDEERHTVGLRKGWTCPMTGVETDLEAAYQFGESGADDIKAWMAAATVRSPKDWLPHDARMFAGYDYASGDEGIPGEENTFDPLYTHGHAFLGDIDFAARKNILAGHVGVSAKPLSRLQLEATAWYFQRAENTDGVSYADGQEVFYGDENASHDLGWEFDLVAKYRMNRHTQFDAGYAYYRPGDFFKGAGDGRDSDFFYTTATLTF